MKSIFKCRRTVVSLFAISCLTLLGLKVGAEVGGAIATVALALSGVNAAQNIFSKKKEGDENV